jgi:pheromone shutdown protein TraB
MLTASSTRRIPRSKFVKALRFAAASPLALAVYWLVPNADRNLKIMSPVESADVEWFRVTIDDDRVLYMGKANPNYSTDQRPLLDAASTRDTAVSVFRRQGRWVYILGASQTNNSPQSAALARQLVLDVHPHAVYLETDMERVEHVRNQLRRKTFRRLPDFAWFLQHAAAGELQYDPTQQKRTTTQQFDNTVFDAQTQSPFGTIVRLVLMAAIGHDVCSRLEQKAYCFPNGGELAMAYQSAKKIQADVIMGDQKHGVTCRRIWLALWATDIWQLRRNVRAYLPALEQETNVLNKEEAGAETREDIRKSNQFFFKVAPAFMQVLMQERDEYMASGIHSLEKYPVTVAVMGMSHLDGVEAALSRKGWERIRWEDVDQDPRLAIWQDSADEQALELEKALDCTKQKARRWFQWWPAY